MTFINSPDRIVGGLAFDKVIVIWSTLPDIRGYGSMFLTAGLVISIIEFVVEYENRRIYVNLQPLEVCVTLFIHL